MLIIQKPMITESSHTVCPFHKKYPGKHFAGCTCSSTYIYREKTDDEIIKDERELCLQFYD